MSERKLTPKQQRFVEVYAGNATEPAKLAGYSDKTAYSIGQENLNKPEIQDAIAERQPVEARPLIASRQERQAFWTRMMRDEDADLRDRLRAAELLGRSEADFVERHQHDPGDRLMELLPRLKPTLGLAERALASR